MPGVLIELWARDAENDAAGLGGFELGPPPDRSDPSPLVEPPLGKRPATTLLAVIQSHDNYMPRPPECSSLAGLLAKRLENFAAVL